MVHRYSRTDYPDGSFSELEWFLDDDGSNHRDDGPAHRRRERDGSTSMAWCKHGEIIAVLKRSPDGTITSIYGDVEKAHRQYVPAVLKLTM